MSLIVGGSSVVRGNAEASHRTLSGAYVRPEHGTGSFADKCRLVSGLIAFVLMLLLMVLVGTYPRAIAVATLLYFAL